MIDLVLWYQKSTCLYLSKFVSKPRLVHPERAPMAEAGAAFDSSFVPKGINGVPRDNKLDQSEMSSMPGFRTCGLEILISAPTRCFIGFF